MINPVGMSLAALTVMLWILWSDTMRKRRPSAVLYAVRIALYLIVSGILILNVVRYPRYFGGNVRTLALVTVVVGFVGAGYFARRLVMRK
jgi:hypothetical protein